MDYGEINMKLKSIEIYGFKSFAEPIQLNFNQPVSIIVGPNGSGKSNISDAVWWVLGEQSAKNLRGGTMQDIIFAGTEKKQALNYARVTITFDNETGDIPLEYKEISITRKLFRNGESEYYINKSQVRLKDIRELFMDTGIGKEGYSLIGQGKIDEIISGNSDVRREIFEEASGVTKYKYKLENSIRKLEKTKDDIQRIEDILFQLNERYDYLKTEAEKAQKGIEASKELEELELENYYCHIMQMKNNLHDKKSTTELMKEQVNELEKLLKIKKQDLSPLKNEKDNLKKKKDILLSSCNEMSQKSIVADKRILVLTEKENYLQTELKRLQRESEEFSIRMENLEKNLSEKKESFIKLIQKVNIIRLEKEEIEKYKDNYIIQVNEIEKQIKQQENKISKGTEKLNDLIVRQTTRHEITQNILNNQIQIKQEQDKIEKSLAQIGIEIENIQESAEIEIEKANRLKQHIEEIKRRIIKTEEVAHSLQIEISKTEALSQEKRSNYSILDNMYKNYEGYYYSVQQLMQESKKRKEVKELFLGVLGDLIHTDIKYQRAIDAALGSAVQNIIVKDEDAAKTIIDYLKKNKIGRMTFLPISKIKGKKISWNLEGVVASSVVQFDNQIKEIVESFLGRTILVGNMDLAIRLRNSDKQNLRFITLDGEVFNPIGSIIGGYSKSGKSSLINRKHSLDILKKELEDIEHKLVEKRRSFEETGKKIKLEKEKLSDLTDALGNINVSIENRKKEEDTLNLKYALLSDNLLQLKKKWEEKKIEPEKDLLQDVDNQKDIIQKDKEFLNLLEEKNLEIKVKSDETLKRFYQKVNELEIGNRDISLLKNDIGSLEDSIQTLFQSHTNSMQLMKKLIEDNKILENDLIKSKSEKDELEKSLNIARTELEGNQKKCNEIEEIIVQKTNESEKINNDLLDIRHRMEISAIQVSGYEEKLEELTVELFSAYSYSVEDLEKIFSGKSPSTVSKAKLKSIRDTVKEIGYFSIASIYEFQEVLKEKEFTEIQLNDLNQSKEDITEIITDLENRIIFQFEKETSQIKLRFQEVFHSLFGGGQAELVIEEVCSLKPIIEIKAQPPGKNLQNLSLLSGGEKTLTAIALLFAIFSIRSTPFCILDEIDASLDETNIGRYVDYLTEFHKEIQFIVITHRKRTMEMADQLYGVTMDDDGISKVLSLELSERENDLYVEESRGYDYD